MLPEDGKTNTEHIKGNIFLCMFYPLIFAFIIALGSWTMNEALFKQESTGFKFYKSLVSKSFHAVFLWSFLVSKRFKPKIFVNFGDRTADLKWS